MGQRAFRGRLTDSLIKNYLSSPSENSLIADCSTSPSTSNKSDDIYFQGKLVHLNLEFNIDAPLNDIGDINIALSKGVINATIPNGKKIKNLNLVIKSNLFGEGKTPLHSNLYVLFGSHFYRDILHIHIKLFNPLTNRFFNDRKTISNILDFMCFKTIKVVHINNSLLYYVIPEYSKFAIVLAYKDINLFEKEFNFLTCLEDLLFHPYCTFERTEENYMRCLNAIERTVPREVCNIILPIIYFNNLNPDSLISGSNGNKLYGDLYEFIKEIKMRFKIMSLELKVKFIDEKENFKTNLNLLEINNLKFINLIIEENYDLITQFTYSYISFDFFNYYIPESKNIYNSKILDEFKQILKNKKLENITLANHITYTNKNMNTNLDDNYDYYDYVHYDKSFADKIWTLISIFKKHKVMSKLYKRKMILDNLLKNLFDVNKIYKVGRLNYSTELVKNKKIVPFEVDKNHVMVFTN